MPSHNFICRDCGERESIITPIGESPPHPYCQDCKKVYAKVFSFDFAPIQKEIHSQSVGKHGSVRSYNTARDRLSEAHTERVGMDVNFESFDPRDTDMDPTK